MYLSDRLAVVATTDPQAIYDDATATTDFVDMSVFDKVMFIICIGATDITVDALLQESDASNGSSPSSISGKALTQVTADDDNKQFTIEVSASECSKRYVGCNATIGDGSTGAFVTVIGIAGDARYSVGDSDLTSVAEIVTA